MKRFKAVPSVHSSFLHAEQLSNWPIIQSMVYSNRLFAAELLVELERGLAEAEPPFDPVRIGRWAYGKFLSYTGKMETGLDDKIMTIVLMEEGSEFELTIDEIREFSKSMI